MIRIDIFSDVVCPWCYIGETRLRAALGQRPGVEAELHWQPFQLQPDMPREGVDWHEYAQKKFGGLERAGEMFEHVTSVGQELGLELNFDRMTRSPNTADAHRLILLARNFDREWETAHALFRAHFTDGRNLSDHAELAAITGDAGLDADQVRAFLESDEGLDLVQQSQESAGEIGITGVPFFIFNSQYAVSGAQPEEVFLSVLDRLEEEVAAD